MTSSSLIRLCLLVSLPNLSSSSIFGTLSSMASGVLSPASTNHNQQYDTGIPAALEILALTTKFMADEIISGQRTSQRPFVTISYAQTIDGSILLHSLRACHDGVLVGINTVLADDPQLNVRDPLPGIVQSSPRPIVVDSDLKIVDYPCSRLRLKAPIICTCLTADSDRWQLAEVELRAVNGTLLSCRRNEENRCDLKDCLALLKEKAGLQSLLVEGGAGIIQSVLESRLVDQVVVTIRPSFLGGYRSLTRELPLPMHLENAHVASVGGDIVLYSTVQDECPVAVPSNSNRAAVALIHAANR